MWYDRSADMRHLAKPNLARVAAMGLATAVLVATFVVETPAFAQAPSGVTNERALEHLARAQEAFNREDYAAAIPELKSAYALDPDPTLLYAWAQAERFNGDCKRALELYRRYLDTDPPAKQRNLAEANVVDCEAEVGPAAVAGDTPADTGTEVTDPEPEATAPEASTDGPEPKPWFKDWLAPTLAGAGVAAAGTGVAFVILGVQQGEEAPSAVTEMDYLDADDGARTKHTAGWVLVGIGGALIVAGGIRYALLATGPRKSKAKTEQARLRPRFGGTGIAFRF